MKHLIQLWPCDWAKQFSKMNEAVGTKNNFTVDGGGRQILRPFRRQWFWKCISWVLLEFTYGNKVHKLWIEILKYFGRTAPTKLRRDVC